jgi:hypothetical protein
MRVLLVRLPMRHSCNPSVTTVFGPLSVERRKIHAYRSTLLVRFFAVSVVPFLSPIGYLSRSRAHAETKSHSGTVMENPPFYSVSNRQILIAAGTGVLIQYSHG